LRTTFSIADADRYRLFVRDTGPGVPAHELERIFEPFHRVAPDRARESGGAGLGLAITARVMNAQGGGCRARNLARGLEISLWWPPA
jgi:signal transduction histidine kinase